MWPLNINMNTSIRLRDATYFYLLILLLIQVINCLKINKFVVPKTAFVGDKVHLLCIYDLAKGESLYTLKWYRDETEFFRIEPSARPGPLYFTVVGINVDKEYSNGSSVILNDVNKLTSGSIVCEVSTEKTFQTVVAEQNLTVLSFEEAYSNDGLNKHSSMVTFVLILSTDLFCGAIFVSIKKRL